MKNLDETQLPWKSVSFACGGWLQFYLYGVARAFQAQGLDSQNVAYCGCSAGALAAVGLVLDGDFDAAMTYCKDECIPRAHTEVLGLFQLGEYVTQCLELHLLPKYKPIPSGQLQIAVTRLPFFTTERVVEYSSREDLKSALLASSAAFPAAPLVFRGNSWCIDGGISDFQPIIDEDTLTVSPFYFSDCDIKPSRYVPLWWAFLPPRSADTVDWLYSLGFNDALDYFKKRGLEETSRSRAHIQRLVKNPHPFDEPRRVSVHRFLGYNLTNLTHEYISFVLDGLLLAFLMAVWRPLALLLIYCELMVSIVWELVASALLELYSILPLFLFTSLMFYPNVSLTVSVSSLICAEKNFLFGSSSTVSRKLRHCLDCLSCLFSLSLLLRFFTSYATAPREALRKHHRLVKASLLYRVFSHMI